MLSRKPPNQAPLGWTWYEAESDLCWVETEFWRFFFCLFFKQWLAYPGVFKKIRETKGTFHAKMVIIKDRNSMDLTEAEDIKKRWQEYKEDIYKKDLHDPDNHNDVITILEPTSWNANSSGP